MRNCGLITVVTFLVLVDTDVSAAAGAEVSYPEEGRWSIGCGWSNEAPKSWHHADAGQTTEAGAWTIQGSSLKKRKGGTGRLGGKVGMAAVVDGPHMGVA